MKLHADEVSRIVNKLMTEWRGQHLVTFKATDEVIRARLNEIFLKELRVEDDLNLEVEKMLAKYEKEFANGALDRRKMFTMVKNQLAKEKKIIL